MLCKVTSHHSQSKLKKLLENFVKSDCRLLLLVANMQELTRKMINHLRIMIEEEENKLKPRNTVQAIHYLPSFSTCHVFQIIATLHSSYRDGTIYYIDTVAHGTLTIDGVRAVVDMKEWLHHCCFPQQITSYAIDNENPSSLQTNGESTHRFVTRGHS